MYSTWLNQTHIHRLTYILYMVKSNTDIDQRIYSTWLNQTHRHRSTYVLNMVKLNTQTPINVYTQHG